jgi:hypothetical protein
MRVLGRVPSLEPWPVKGYNKASCAIWVWLRNSLLLRYYSAGIRNYVAEV